MGRFFSNIQIQNNQNENREQFAKSFCKSMEKKGYISSTEDDSSLTYVLAFSENNKWITLCSADYESGGEDVKKDVQFLAESLKTCCISTSVVDSDFAILEMYNAASTLTDMVAVGDGSGYGFDDDTEFKGRKEAWEPYLTSGSTWEQLSAIWDKDFTFAEEALSEMAPLIGMDSENIISDYDDISNRTDKNIMQLHFKKKGKKALSLNAAFIQVFGEALEPLGFVKLKKVKHPYFVRVINGEILHVVSYCREQSGLTGYSSFNIIGGVATAYQQHIDFTKSTQEWLRVLYMYPLPKLEADETFEEYKYSILHFPYKSDNDESLLSALKRSFEATKRVMLPIIDEAVDINSCIEYYYKVNSSFMNLYDVDKIIDGSCHTEGLLLIKANYRDDGIERMEQELATLAQSIKEGRCGYGQKEFENECEHHNNFRLRQIAIRDKMLDDPELNAKVMAELERRKAKNIKIFKSYGLEIK